MRQLTIENERRSWDGRNHKTLWDGNDKVGTQINVLILVGVCN